MKIALTAALALIAAPALAHVDATIHLHGSDAAFWGLALIAAAVLAGAFKRKSVRVRRDR